MVHYSVKMVEVVYIMVKRKPLYSHFYFSLKQLTKNQKSILKNEFTFYNKLTKKQKRYFEHRLALFIKDKDFVGRQGFVINDKERVLISATAVMLTFGFRDFYIGLIEKIIVYPKAFYSKINQELHKGEFNPKLKALVLSWEDFKEGYDIENDNLNLGVHEFSHAIHLNCIRVKDVNSVLFLDSYKELIDLLSEDKTLKSRLVDSRYFREYAYTNQYEFLAVLVEYFIESPSEFRSIFPQIYAKVRQMLNMNYGNY